MEKTRMIPIYYQQQRFQEYLGNNTNSNEYRKQMVLGLLEESVEIMKTFPAKAHKKHQEFNKDEFVKECVDAQLYLMNLLLSADVEWEDFEDELYKKQRINMARQQNGY